MLKKENSKIVLCVYTYNLILLKTNRNENNLIIKTLYMCTSIELSKFYVTQVIGLYIGTFSLSSSLHLCHKNLSTRLLL